MTDEPVAGVERITVRSDGTREFEAVGPDHPVVGPLASVVAAELRSHIAGGTLGLRPERFELEGLPASAFSIAEEVDYYFTLSERASGDVGTVDDGAAPGEPGVPMLTVVDPVRTSSRPI